MATSIKKNYIYNLLYQAFLLIVPFVVTPYVSRVLTPEGIGQYSFSYTIVNYFVVFASLGFNVYCQREIARFRDNKLEQSKIFFETFICKFASVFVTFILCIGIAFLTFFSSYTTLILILSMNIIAVLFDISFLFQGNENFGVIVFRNFVIKLSCIILIFIFVKDINDLRKYTLINALMALVSNISLWFRLGKTLVKVPLRNLKPLRHLKSTMQLFIPTLATTIYVLLNKTMIGFLIQGTTELTSGGVVEVVKIADLENGFYDSADKIIKMALTVLTSIGTVMISRNSYELKRGNIGTVKSNLYKTARFIFLLGVPMTFGIISISSNLVPWFYGTGYDKVIPLLDIGSSLFLIIGLSNCYSYLYLTPAGYEKKLGFIAIATAILDVVLCFALIPFFYSIGALLASVGSEIFTTVLMIIVARKEISFLHIIKSSRKYILSGIFMFACTFTTSLFISSSVLNTFLIIGLGIIVYFIFLLLLRDDFFIKLLLMGIRKVVILWKKILKR